MSIPHPAAALRKKYAHLPCLAYIETLPCVVLWNGHRPTVGTLLATAFHQVRTHLCIGANPIRQC
jgi:hypothetical protein